MNAVLVAYDGSASSRRALDETAKLARNGTAVTVVSVAEPLPQVGRAAAMRVPEEDELRRRQLDEAREILRERGIEAATVERCGDPAAMIVDEAAAEGADLIVLGTRGLGARKRLLHGSVSTAVLHHATSNVLVVR
jgi:nucleotide-binding universal stress UspA family protein